MSISALRTNEEITRIYDSYADSVYRVCFLILKNTQETEDVVQNVFIKLMNYPKAFESEEHIKAWLIIVAKNECINVLKHWWNAKRTELDSIKEPAYQAEAMNDGLTKDILKLPDKYKLPLYLHYYEGYTTSEIAGLLKVKESTLRTRLVAARKQLKGLLEVEADG